MHYVISASKYLLKIGIIIISNSHLVKLGFNKPKQVVQAIARSASQ